MQKIQAYTLTLHTQKFIQNWHETKCKNYNNKAFGRITYEKILKALDSAKIF